jgi:hypothetical protein
MKILQELSCELEAKTIQQILLEYYIVVIIYARETRLKLNINVYFTILHISVTSNATSLSGFEAGPFF